jgi:hypothetical protein
MTNDAIETHLAGLDPRYQPVARALHAAILQAAPELRAAIKWGRLSYLLDGSGLLWVCAITTTGQGWRAPGYTWTASVLLLLMLEYPA